MSTQLNPKAKKFGKLILIGLLLGSAYLGLKHYGVLDKIYGKSVTLDKQSVDLPTAPANAQTIGLVYAGVPSTTITSKSLPSLTIAIPEWNALLGLIYSNGSSVTSEGSLMEKSGVKLTLKRQDDDGQASTDLIKFAIDYQKNSTTAIGINAFVDMGDGTPAILAGINQQLSKLDGGKCDYCAVIVTAFGVSYGEDALLGSPKWKEDPKNAMGSVISTVLRNGDFNTAIKWAIDNNIPLNVDEKTYDPGAMNFVNAPDFLKAAELYISDHTEEREVVKNGVDMHKKITIHIDGCATWTPGDVNVAQKKGGLVKIASTRDYTSQMPAVLITIRKYAQDNHLMFENLLDAAFKGGDQVKSFSGALQAAGDISAKVYNDQTGDYWVKYAKGTTESDKTGMPVDLGGSKQFNMGDALNTFGIAPGSSNTFGIVYQTFSKIYLQLFPDLFKTGFQTVDQVLDLTYLQNLSTKQIKSGEQITAASTQNYSSGAGSQIVASKPYSIEFAIGSSQLTTNGLKTVNDIANSLLVANGLKATIDGYTDNSGGSDRNQKLSLERAQAVKAEIQKISSANFPDVRFTINGYGSDYSQLLKTHQFIGDNNTLEGKQSNRRVQISMTK